MKSNTGFMQEHIISMPGYSVKKCGFLSQIQLNFPLKMW